MLDHGENKGVPGKYLLCFTDYAKTFDCVDHNQLWKILKEMSTRPPYLSPEKPVWNQQATARTRHGTTNWFKIRKEYGKPVSCHPAYLTYLHSTSWEMLGWMNHKLEQDCQEK